MRRTRSRAVVRRRRFCLSWSCSLEIVIKVHGVANRGDFEAVVVLCDLQAWSVEGEMVMVETRTSSDMANLLLFGVGRQT